MCTTLNHWNTHGMCERPTESEQTNFLMYVNRFFVTHRHRIPTGLNRVDGIRLKKKNRLETVITDDRLYSFGGSNAKTFFVFKVLFYVVTVPV